MGETLILLSLTFNIVNPEIYTFKFPLSYVEGTFLSTRLIRAPLKDNLKNFLNTFRVGESSCFPVFLSTQTPSNPIVLVIYPFFLACFYISISFHIAMILQ